MTSGTLNTFALAVSLALAPIAGAQDAAPDPATPAPAPAAAPVAEPLTLAVLRFDAKDPTNDQLGTQVADAVAALLGDVPGTRLVNRTDIDRVLEEQALNLTGLTDEATAVKVAKLVGAKLLVTGRVFTVGQTLFLSGKVIGTETSLVESVLVKGSPRELDTLLVEVGTKLAQTIEAKGATLVAAPAAADPLPALHAKLKGRTLPKVAVLVPETHVSQRPAPDPAVETELKKMLVDAGVVVQDVRGNDLADWAANLDPQHVDRWPQGLADVDWVVTGKAFSESGVRLNNLISCSARAELNVIRRSDGRILKAARVTSRGVDLSEQVASKGALQKAGHALGIELLQLLDEQAPPAAAP